MLRGDPAGMFAPSSWRAYGPSRRRMRCQAGSGGHRAGQSGGRRRGGSVEILIGEREPGADAAIPWRTIPLMREKERADQGRRTCRKTAATARGSGDGRAAAPSWRTGSPALLDAAPGACALPGARTSRPSALPLRLRFSTFHRHHDRSGTVICSCMRSPGECCAGDGMYRSRRALWQLLASGWAAADAALVQCCRADTPDCFSSLNMTLGFGRGLTAVCRRSAFRPSATWFSWDHPSNTNAPPGSSRAGRR